MGLAILGAILQPEPNDKHAPHYGIRKAMEFYIDAVLLWRDLPTDLEQLVTGYGSDDAKRALEKQIRDWVFGRVRDKFLELGPQSKASSDKVLAFLAARGLHIETTKAVIENLKRFHERPPSDLPGRVQFPPDLRRSSPKEFIAQFRQRKQGCTTYRFPKRLLTRAAEYAAWCRIESKHKGAATKKAKKAAA
jgi:hypothetical protein